jgi:uncharacterized membrane protein
MDKSSTSLNPNVAALLSYLFGWISGLIFYLIETKSEYVRFHATQSLIVFGAISIIAIVLFFIPFLGILSGILSFVLWILLMFKAYQGEKFELPFAGDLAEKWAVRKV